VVPPAAKKNLAGWYEAGTTPGETGTAIVAGHVDDADGPAVFYELGALRRNSVIEVDRRDGTVAVFTVDAVEVHDARHFPDEKVYGAAARPELRVITCGGGYSRSTGYRGTSSSSPTSPAAARAGDRTSHPVSHGLREPSHPPGAPAEGSVPRGKQP
jgi:hypothetical protein